MGYILDKLQWSQYNTRMKKYFLPLVILALIIPLSASAHERRAFKIDNKIYLFTVGSLNEPIYVDDKTGVDLRVKIADPANPTDFNSKNAVPVVGLEQSIQVEISTKEEKRVFALSPVYNDPGAYKTTFFPSNQATYTYRFIGTLNDTNIDIPFTCAIPQEGHTSAENLERKQINKDVEQTFQAGSFGCPKDPSEASFPIRNPAKSDIISGMSDNLLASIIAIIASGISLLGTAYILYARRK